MILETLLPQLEFQSNIKDAVKQKMIKSRRQVEEIAATAYSSNDFDFLLCKRMPLTRLVVVVYLLTQKYAEYKAIGVTDEIILDTFSDVSLRANLYYKQHGKIGISKDGIIVLTDQFGPAGRPPLFLPAPFQSRSFRDIISLHEKNEDTGRRKNAVAGRSPG